MRLFYIVLSLLLLPSAAMAQDAVDSIGLPESARIIPDSALYHYAVSATATSSTRHTPFWLLNNRLGLSSLDKNNGYLRAGFFRRMPHQKRFEWGFGADLAVPYNFTSNFVVQQLYGEIRYRSLELGLGSKNRYMGFTDPELSSGDMTFSLNARPVPQLYFAMPKYEAVPGTNRWLAFKGFFGLGMFSDWRWESSHVGPKGRWNSKVLYNSKALFMRIGDPDRHPVTFEGALEMASQFAGTLHLYDSKLDKEVSVTPPHGFVDLIKGIIPLASSSDGADGNNLLMSDVSNCYGNHLGQWAAALNFNPRSSEWKFRTYYQHFFEDHSMMFFDYLWRDMLLGFEVTFPKNRFIEKFLYEYLITKDQAGAVYHDKTPDIPYQVSGRDSYYNNGLYIGWEHWGMGMGNPLLVSPIYNADHSLTFMHNRVKAHHFGFTGRPTDELWYRALISYTRSWGTYDTPTPNIKRNFNMLLEVAYAPRRLKGWDFRAAIGTDGGSLVGPSFGAMLSIKKTGWLKL